MLKIYHNPRCARSRDGLKYLSDQGLPHNVIHYLDNPLEEADLKRLLMKLNLKPHQVVRTQDELFRKELKGKHFTDEEWIEIILQHPKLLQRPIVEGQYKAVIAQPASRIGEILT
jgi:arsenate reductase